MWSEAANPEFDQPTIDFWINRAYIKVMRDVSDIDVALWTATFLTVPNTTFYPLPPPPPVNELLLPTSGEPLLLPGSGSPLLLQSGPLNPPVAELRRVFYTPVGLGYQLEFEPKVRMLPWKEFQRYTAAGYLNNFSYGTQPEVCSVTPDRTKLAFYPGTANAGDSVELQYSTIPTTGTFVAPLVNETDVPFLPEDFQDLIPLHALSNLWPKARAMEAAGAALKQYYDQLAYVRAMWKRRHGGDQMRFIDVLEARASSGPFGW